MLHEDIRDELHRYTAAILQSWDSPAVLINSVEDHVHILYCQSKNHRPTKIVEEVKKSSSKWIKTKGRKYRDFHWQNGYGEFSVSHSNVPAVTKYIANQQRHHRRVTFQDEFRTFLERHEIPYDERFVWD